MSTPFVGEIRIFAGNFAPQNFAMCSGQTMAIAQNETLFNLIGTTFGGDGQSTFVLPDLRGRVPIHQGTGFVMGQVAGSETATLTVNQIPSHNHAVLATNANASLAAAKNAVWATEPNGITAFYTEVVAGGLTTMNAQSITMAGGNQPHSNLQPSLTISFIIALFGIFPTQN